jgi:ribosomal-protein-alanine N-acetyltransferase
MTRAPVGATKVRVRQANGNDLDALVRLEAHSNPVPWSRQMISTELDRSQGALLVATERGEVIGYICCAGQGDSWHVLNVAVDTGCRNRGVGAQLVDAAIAALHGNPYRRYTLEVRVSNARAIHLYEAAGFRTTGVRRGYYTDNREDAYVMWKDPIPPAGDGTGSEGSVARAGGKVLRG